MPARPKVDRVRRTYEFIKAHQKQFPTEVMCRELGVAPSGYYQWLKCPLSARAVEDVRFLRFIRLEDPIADRLLGRLELLHQLFGCTTGTRLRADLLTIGRRVRSGTAGHQGLLLSHRDGGSTEAGQVQVHNSSRKYKVQVSAQRHC